MRRVLVWNVIWFLLGIVAAVWISAGWIAVFLAMLLVVLVKGLAGREKHFLLLLCMCLSFLAGAMETELFSIRQSLFLKQYEEQYVYLYGKITDEPNVEEDKTTLTVTCRYVESDGKRQDRRETVLVSVERPKQAWHYGDVVSAEGIVYCPRGRMNDKGFSYEGYLRTKGIAALMYCEEDVIKVYHNEAGLPWKAKNFVLRQIDRFIPGEAGAVLKGITLGDKSDFTPEMKTMFARAGISHIVVVSGMHMSILMLFVMYVCKRCGMKKRTRAIAASVVIFCFMCMVGFTPSVLRAGITCIMAMLALLLRRKKDFLTTMAVAAAVVVLLNPYSLFNISFQLSFAATIGIVYLAEPVKKAVGFLPDMIAEIVAMSIAANITTLPITVWYFGDVSLVAVLANVIAVPFVNILFIGTFLLALVGGIFPPLGYFPGYVLGEVTRWVLLAVKKIASWKFAAVTIPQPSMLLNLYYYVAVYAVWMLTEHRHEKAMKVLLCCTAAMAMSFCVVQYWTADAVRIEFINVGQGDSCMVRMPNRHYILIDVGSEGNGNTNNVVDYLKKRGIYTLDCVYISHADRDHSGGLEEVLNHVRVKKVAVPQLNIRSTDMEKLVQNVIRHGVKVELVSAGDSYHAEELQIQALWPIPLSGNSNEANDNNLSMVLRLCYGENVALFMGDLGEYAEEMLLHTDADLRCDILKVAHHGSKTGTSEKLLEKTKPRYSVISVGTNSYGHPAEEVLERLEKCGSVVIRTDESGNIIFGLNRAGRLVRKNG